MNQKIFPSAGENKRLAYMEMILRYMKAGLIHGKRNCPFCLFPMRLNFMRWFHST